MTSAVAAAMSPNIPRAIDSGSTARSTLVTVVAVTLKLPVALGGKHVEQRLFDRGDVGSQGASWMAYQVPSVSASGMSRVYAGV